MPLVGLGDDLSIGDVEGGEQAGRAVPEVVVGTPFGHAGHHRQDQLGAIQRLHLGLFIDAQHHRVLGGLRYSPTTSVTFSMNSGSADSLKVSAR